MRKTLIACVVTGVISSGVTALSWEGDENPATFFRHDKALMEDKSPFGSLPQFGKHTAAQREVAQTIQQQVASRYGSQWVEPAMRIAKLESNYRCSVRGPMTRHGRAVGPMQVLPDTAASVGISPSDLSSSCAAQIEAGMRYLGRCLAAGADTDDKLASCWVSGSPYNHRLAKRYARYREQYIRLAQAAKVPAWVGTLSPWRS